MPHRLQFVCAMNVCRSPLLAAAFTAALPADERGDWAVTSRGTAAREGDEMCAVAGAVLDHDAVPHLSRSVVVTQLENQDLVLVASRAERSALATVAPDLRGRTFTLREAILLDDAPAPVVDVGDDEERPLRRYAASLHLRRGLVLPSRARGLRRRQEDPLDIPDVHPAGGRRHASVLRSAAVDAADMSGRIRRFLQHAGS